MKKIKIFIGSSIDDFKNERTDLSNFLNVKLKNSFQKNFNIDLDAFICENADCGMNSIERSQNKYNRKVEESDIAIFLFGDSVGKYTREEFDTAIKGLSENRNPKVIYPFFKNLDKEQKSDETRDELIKELREIKETHYIEFNHIDTVKMHILFSLQNQLSDCFELTVEDDCCKLLGENLLELKNISEFSNNDVLNKTKRRLAQEIKKHKNIKDEHEENPQNFVCRENLIKSAAEIELLKNKIQEIESNTLKYLLGLVPDMENGEISQRQKNAFEHMKKGNYSEALEEFDFEETQNEYEHYQILTDQFLKKAETFIEDDKTYINILKTQVEDEGRFDEINKRYERIVTIVKKYHVKLWELLEYSAFLRNQYQFRKSIEIAEIYESLSGMSSEKNDEELFGLYNSLAICYKNLFVIDKAEYYYDKALDIGRNLYEKNPLKNGYHLSVVLRNAAILNEKINPVKSENLIREAVDIVKHTYNSSDEEYKHFLSMAYVFIYRLNKHKITEEIKQNCFVEAMDMLKDLESENSVKYGKDLASLYGVYADYYLHINDLKSAKKYAQMSSEKLEYLNKVFPEETRICIAENKITWGLIHVYSDEYKESETCYKTAIGIFRALYPKEPEVAFSIIYVFVFLADLYLTCERWEDAEKLREETETLFDKAIAVNGMVFEPSKAFFHYEIGLVYANQHRVFQAVKSYLLAFKLAFKNRKLFPTCKNLCKECLNAPVLIIKKPKIFIKKPEK